MNASQARRIVLVLAVTAVVSIAESATANATGSADYDPARLSNITVATRLVDSVFNAGDLDAADRLVADDAVIHTRFGDYSGPAGFITYVAALKHTYPGATFSTLAVETSADDVKVDWVMTASQVRIATTGATASVDVELRGSTTIAMENQQVARIAFDPGIAVSPGNVAVSTRAVQDF